jgi:DNA-directed RNA polymerase subunit RPC12/RpoP
MDAKCFNCNNKADFDIEKNKIICKKCNIEIGYDEYIENMKEKALSLADDLQNSWDKQG